MLKVAENRSVCFIPEYGLPPVVRSTNSEGGKMFDYYVEYVIIVLISNIHMGRKPRDNNCVLTYLVTPM